MILFLRTLKFSDKRYFLRNTPALFFNTPALIFNKYVLFDYNNYRTSHNETEGVKHVALHPQFI